MNEMHIIREALAGHINTIRLSRLGNPKSYSDRDLAEAEAVFNKLTDTRHGDYVLYQP